jgi:hypothetical protein
MADQKAITVQTPASIVGKPDVNLVKSDFDALIEQKGYDVWHDHAIKCPCASKNGASPQSSCKNCGGSGWFYINRTKTRIVLQSMNVNTQQKEWSEERLGTANITARSEDRLSFMDRLTLINSESEHSQVVFLEKQPDTNKLYGTLRYNPVEVYSIFLYQGVNTPHKLLEKDVDYNIDRNQIKLVNIEYGSVANPTISVRYRHNAEYTVLDLPRDVMVSTIKDPCTNEKKDVQFPISAIGRRSHYMLDRNDYTNDNLLDNSFGVNQYGDQYTDQYS